jgi:glucose/arabinose dehydrogenase/mono/diheme cytochrome c family protein
MRLFSGFAGLSAAIILFPLLALHGQDKTFRNAPASSKTLKNPYGNQAAAGGELYVRYCSTCHGPSGEGTGNIPAVVKGPTQAAPEGEVFWFVTKGDMTNGMPPWAGVPARERWEIISYLKALSGGKVTATKVRPPREESTAANASLPLPEAPFTDFRFEKPGKFHDITLKDLPAPYASTSAQNGPQKVPRPANAWPQVPAGFKVEMYATDLDQPRLIRTAPNGDFFVAQSRSGEVRIFRGINKAGKPDQVSVFASGLNRPFGINFYPPGRDPQWVYVGDTDAVLRFPYRNGDLKARGPAQKIIDLPANGSHWSRDIQFTPDGKWMYVSVGSASNVDDADRVPAEKDRADILVMNPDGSDMHIFARGIRNAVGLAIDPKTHDLWCSVNERDGLGDNLVPDYITHVQEGGFYGWPWWYMGGHQDPRFPGLRPDLKNKVIAPDVILNPHNASLEMTFYTGHQFPVQYDGDIFAAEHGSWNRHTRVGYELIRVPLHQTGRSNGEFEDFMTGFVINNNAVWGRPVGVTVAPDGSLLVTDDGSGSIWRILYTGKS